MKRRLYTFLNVFGLSLGLVGCGLISLYIVDEWQVDRFHANGNRLYRVLTQAVSQGETSVISGVGRPLARTIREEVPEVERAISVHTASLPVRHNNQYFFDKQLFVDEHFLPSFSFFLIEGDAAAALREPYTAVLTESVARRYFGTTAVVGQTLMIADTLPFRITGVAADPGPSHMEFDLLLSMATFRKLGGVDSDQHWFTWDDYCYVLLPEKTPVAAAERKISALSMKHFGRQYRQSGYEVTHTLEPVPAIYLHSEAGGLNRATGSARQLYLLGAIGLFILLLACINFVNLTTAHQGERAREVGVRKAIGAAYTALIGQFVGESLLLAFMAGGLALASIAGLLPYLNSLVEKQIPLSVLGQPASIGSILAVLILTGLLAGLYPAFVLARFQPVDTLKGQRLSGGGNAWLRRGLVVFQFGISLILIIGTLMVVRQLHFMQNRQLGFRKDRVLAISLKKTPHARFIGQYESIRQEIASLPNVEAVTGAAALPGKSGWDGQLVWVEGRPEEETVTLEVITVDHDYARTLGLKIRSGRDYDRRITTDAQEGILLNEAACKAFGWSPSEAIGKKLKTAGMEQGRVVGVLADYHQHDLRKHIRPVLTFIAPYAFGYMAVRLGPGDLQTSVARLEQFWHERFPGYEFEYTFLDDQFNQQYKAEERLARIFGIFAGLAVVIACLGLFGLAAFTAQQRTKEIGIRKVLGASVPAIVGLLSRDFLKLVLVAVLLASPIAWYLTNRWLQDFAYRIGMEWWVFALAGLLAVLIAFVTVSFQSIKAALLNPVKSLRTE